MYELMINFLEDRKDKDPEELAKQDYVPNNVKKKVHPKAKVILFTLILLGFPLFIFALIAFDLRLPQLQRGGNQDSTSELLEPTPTNLPTIGFVDLDDSNSTTTTPQSVSTELEVIHGNDRALKTLQDVSGANKHQEAFQSFFGESRQLLVIVEEATLFGGWKPEDPKGLVLTIQYAHSLTEFHLSQESQTIYLNSVPTAVIVDYVGQQKLRLTLSVPKE